MREREGKRERKKRERATVTFYHNLLLDDARGTPKPLTFPAMKVKQLEASECTLMAVLIPLNQDEKKEHL